MTIVLFSQDLMVISQVSGAAAQHGSLVRAVSSTSDAVEACAAKDVELVIVDLGAPSVDVAAFVDQLKSSTARVPRIVAFGPHVHVDKLAAAREAGCDVMSRGQFLMQVGSVLAG
jgi:DNA-binding response OmpR family regulator